MELEAVCAAARIAALELVDALGDRIVNRSLRPDDFAHLEGDFAETISVILDGQVLQETYPTGSWEPAPVMVWGTGGLVGEEGLSPACDERLSAIRALTPTRLAVIAVRDLQRVEAAHAQRVATMLTARSLCLVRALAAAAGSTVDLRIVRWLLHLDATMTDGGNRPTLKLSQELLATLARTRRPTANAVLRHLADAGLVDVGRARVTVLDTNALAEHAAQLDELSAG